MNIKLRNGPFFEKTLEKALPLWGATKIRLGCFLGKRNLSVETRTPLTKGVSLKQIQMTRFTGAKNPISENKVVLLRDNGKGQETALEVTSKRNVTIRHHQPLFKHTKLVSQSVLAPTRQTALIGLEKNLPFLGRVTLGAELASSTGLQLCLNRTFQGQRVSFSLPLAGFIPKKLAGLAAKILFR